MPPGVIGTYLRTSTDPPANTEIVFTADIDMIVHSLYFTFATDANVANRAVSVAADDGTTKFFRSGSPVPQAASSTLDYCAVEGTIEVNTGWGGRMNLPAGGLRLRKGDRIVTITSSRQVGDNFGPMTLQVEHFS